MRTAVRIIVLLSAALLFCVISLRYTSSTSSTSKEESWRNDEVTLSRKMTVSDSDFRSGHILTDKHSSDSSYDNLILDHEFPNCQGRTIYNGYAKYSMPDILEFIHQFIPPHTSFVEHLKNPCWFANYDKAMSEINWKVNYTEKVKEDVSYLLPKTSGTETLYCLPYMYLLGYPKCGTTSLYDYFKKHPEFATLSSRGCGWIGLHTSGLANNHPAKVKSVLHLLTHFYLASRQIEISSTDHNVNNKVIADFSPASSWRQHGFEQYMNGSMCDPPLLLREIQPDAKFVVLLREPISRLYSAFWFYAGDEYGKRLSREVFIEDVQTFFDRLKQCHKQKSMLQCLREAQMFDHHFKDVRHGRGKNDQLLTGFYYLYLLPWLQVFPRENFLFIRSEDMREDTGKALQEIFQFLGMSTLPEKQMSSIVAHISHNQKILHSNNTDMLLTSSTKKLLRAYFRPFNEKLAELLNDDRFLWEDVD